MASLLMTGYIDKCEKTQQKVDKIAYEKFPYCCSSGTTAWDSDTDLRKSRPIKKKPVLPVQSKPTVVKEKVIVPKVQAPVSFWTEDKVNHYNNVLTAFQTYNFEGDRIIDNKVLSPQDLTTKTQFLKKKYSEIKTKFVEEANKEYTERQRQGSTMSNEEYSDILLQINYDIAWQIFDDVNQMNDTLCLIDLTCLDLTDAQAITK